MAEKLNTLYYALGLDDTIFQTKLTEAIKQVSELDKVAQKVTKVRLPSMKTPPIDTTGIKGLKNDLQNTRNAW